MSATAMDVRFNINCSVSVKLTKEGVAKWYRHYESYGIIGDGPKIDANGWTQFQLWVLMSIFGEELGNGMPTMFETEIVLHGARPRT